jgi:hypothetical protein
VDPWQKADRGRWRGQYKVVPDKQIFVIVTAMGKGARSSVYECPVAVPFHWVSKCFKFVAVPNDDFYSHNLSASSDDKRFDQVVDEGFFEFPIGLFATDYGCKYTFSMPLI